MRNIRCNILIQAARTLKSIILKHPNGIVSPIFQQTHISAELDINTGKGIDLSNFLKRKAFMTQVLDSSLSLGGGL